MSQFFYSLNHDYKLFGNYYRPYLKLKAYEASFPEPKYSSTKLSLKLLLRA
jgi:hypothetical protein